MHTTTVMRAVDFQYWHVDAHGQRTQGDFASFCPQYHIQDRIGVVVPRLDTAVYQTGYALLACTTAFYEVLRQRTAAFFDYPHHFAFCDVNEDGVATHGQRLQLSLEALGSPWGALDVWPESNWIVASGSASGMLKKVFDWQINRLFWPEAFLPSPGEAAFPDYVRKIFSARLKTIYYYNTAHPTLEIHVTPPVEAMLQRSLSRLPEVPEGRTAMAADTMPVQDTTVPSVRHYRQVPVQAFLTAMQPCFADTAACGR
jgi:hypothetical protein